VLSRAVGLDRHFHLDFARRRTAGRRLLPALLRRRLGTARTRRIRAVARPSRRAAGGGIADQPGAGLRRPGQRQRRRPARARLPPENLRDSLDGTARLPLPPRFKPGQIFDGLRIDEVLHDSRATLLYQVTDQLSGRQLVLKTLRPELADDAEEIRA
jgi:hypothetical protein